MTTIRAAGGVLWRDHDGELQFAVVHRPRHDDWSLPKGKLESAEHPLAAACREVLEETGVRPVVGARLAKVSYRVPAPSEGETATKVVDYWTMRATDGEFTPNREVDGVRWVALEPALKLLSYQRDQELVRAFAARPKETARVLLLRHGLAGERSEWPGIDVTRPLEPAGEQQAIELAELLAWYAPDRISSATPRRCVQTVRPLAAKLSMSVEADGIFDEDAHERNPERAAERVRHLASLRGTTVVCSQGGVIPDVVALIADTDDLPVPTVRTPKGSAWVLSFAGTVLVAADLLTLTASSSGSTGAPATASTAG